MQNFGGVGKKLKVLVYDFGMSFVHAQRMAQDGHEVRYFTHWSTAFPKFSDYSPGLGYEDEGVTKVMYFFENIDWADMVYFPDVGAGDIAQYIRDKTGKPVFGAAKSEKMEMNREFMRDLQKKLGMPVQNTEKIKGVPMLREYLKQNEKKYVKVDVFRGDIESFYAKNYDDVKLYLDEIEVKLGAFNETYNFMVEDFIDGIEPGFDLFFSGGDFIKPYMWGIEQSKSCYIGKYVDQMPKPLQEMADKLKPYLASVDYRGAISIEVRITKDGTPYLIDVCTRYPFPLSAGYTVCINNYSQIVWEVANGNTPTIIPNGKYMAAMPLSTKHANDYYVKLTIDPKYRKFIKTRLSAKQNGIEYGVKGIDTVFVPSVSGKNYMELIEVLKFLATKCDTYALDTDITSGLDKIKEVMEKYKSYGMGEF